MRIAFKRTPLDILSIVLLSVLLALLATISLAIWLRVLLGFLSVLLFPGYVLVAAFFPDMKEIDWTERIALSFGLSIAVVPLLMVIVNFTPWGITLESTLITNLLFVLATSLVAYHRRMRLPEEERLSLSITFPPPSWSEYSGLEKVLTLVLAVSIAITGVALAYVLTSPSGGDRYTEFYILDKDGRTDNYPTQLNVSEQGNLTVGVVNHEAATINYTIHAVLSEVRFVYNVSAGRNDTVAINNSTLGSFSASIGDGVTWEQPFDFSVADAGDYLLRFFLYQNTSLSEPYRSLYLLIKVTV
jgi:uncharacterized membrane protein